MSNEPTVRASVLVLVRDAPRLQTLLLRRIESAGADARHEIVFPGGRLSAADRLGDGAIVGLTDSEADRRLALEGSASEFYVAAMRECLEETGLLLARHADGSATSPEDATFCRAELLSGAQSLGALCGSLGIALDAGALHYFAHWVTPLGRPKRFDTRFFIAMAPHDFVATPDSREHASSEWIEPEAALQRAEINSLALPTVHTLKWLARHADAAAAIRTAASLTEVPRWLPRSARTARGPCFVHPSEPSWPEIGLLDPEGKGAAFAELRSGIAVRLTPRVVRVVAPNSGYMTGPGTNSYFVGDPSADDWTLIDPGPADDRHVAALLAALPGRLRRIVVTHTHRDHSPAANAIRSATGAPVLGMRARYADWQDEDFAPDTLLKDGDTLAIGPNMTLEVVHTPGHASNHLCYLLPRDRILFTGDHIIQHSTVVIGPPDGNMDDYLASLRRITSLAADWIAPGHGFLMENPAQVAKQITAHRLSREADVVTALRDYPRTLEELTREVYQQLDARLLGVAARSMLAHLIRLEGLGRARQSSDGWRRSTMDHAGTTANGNDSNPVCGQM